MSEAQERSSLAEQARAARAHVRPAWDDALAAHLTERAKARQRRRTIARGVAAGGLAVAAIALLAVLGRSAPGVGPEERPLVAHHEGGVLRFHDGSIATPLDGETELLVDAMREDAIELVLVRGAARFEVTPGLPRAFRVRAGRVTVSVVGTVFTVRRAGEGAEVSVDEGRVRIAWDPAGDATLGAGEHGTYPSEAPLASAAGETAATREGHAGEESATRDDPPSGAAPEAEEASAPASSAGERRAAPAARRAAVRDDTPEGEPPVEADRSGWRALADRGEFSEGYSLLLADPTVLPSRDVEALMQAADCARLSGHPAESLAYLRRALEVGVGDPRAPMAAFTLGRVLLQQLDRPRDAAEAFARARALSPEGSLASDALAREVEAWHRAGDAARARERALEYLRLYPEGLRASAVRQHGGLE